MLCYVILYVGPLGGAGRGAGAPLERGGGLVRLRGGGVR